MNEADDFMQALLRASKTRLYFLRSMRRADRDDAIAMAIAWCWENREKFDPTRGTLEVWWSGALRNAIQTIRRGVARHETRRSYRTVEEVERLSHHASGAPRPGADSERGKAPIDHEIERLLRRPRHERADCPSCWRCRWYDGLRPGTWRPRPFADPEVAAAVRAVEQRKIEIAGARYLIDKVEAVENGQAILEQ